LNIAFATSVAQSDLTPDDRLAVAALTERGARVTAAVWSDPSVEWTAFDSIVVRSTWDYHRHAQQFRDWIEALEVADARVWNPPAVLRWNMEKTYLRDLERAGVPVVPTAWLSRGSAADFGALLEERSWRDAVVKPVISAGANRTWRIAHAIAPETQAQLAESLELGDVMVQPFVPEIQTNGEWSLMFIDGEFSHAVRKTPTEGDFRVQAGFGGRSDTETPDCAVLNAARRVLDAAPAPWLYVRVDGIETESGFVLLELEMLEPALFFSHSPAGTVRFAESIISRVLTH
jgi:hypothetical protein